METNTVEVPAKFKSLVETIETMSVLDLNELVKLLERNLASQQLQSQLPLQPLVLLALVKKMAFAVHLTDAGAQKIAVIKAVKEVQPSDSKKQKTW